MARTIKRELGIFLIVGLLTVSIDFLSYHGLMYFKPFGLESISLAKGFGFMSGTVFAYFANRFWTFKLQTTDFSSLYRFAIVYIFGLASNIVVNHFAISWFSSPTIALDITLFIAFILATGVSAALNFIGMKFFVFTKRPIDYPK